MPNGQLNVEPEAQQAQGQGMQALSEAPANRIAGVDHWRQNAANSSSRQLAPTGAVPEVLQALAAAAGFRFNGDAPWDIRVTDARLYQRVLLKGSLGFGESYMEGWWECERLDEMFHRLLSADVDQTVAGWTRLRALAEALRQALFNPQSSRRAYVVAERHYDLGNDIFETMLDSSLSYSCAYWQRAQTLEQAQRDKLDMICRKLELRPGERLLDIGCGWGGLAQHAARHYGAQVLGITVSKEQQALARQRCAGLPVSIELMDYRDLGGQFDKLVSVGMFEHVGERNYPSFFSIAERLLKDQGLFLLHTIGSYRQSRKLDPWINKYVFPNGQLPSAAQIAGHVEDRFLIEDWHSFGADYDRTLMAWWENFQAGWPRLEAKYGARFYRMWKYYLMSCAGFFRSRQGQLWQLVLAKRARQASYCTVR
jgi:cyclopropane-fatty-acyl-phospholipid synthase